MPCLRYTLPLLLLLAACGTVRSVDGDSGAGDADTGVTRGTCEAPPQARGILSNDVADIDFTGEEVQATVEHKLDIDIDEDGCVVRLSLTMKKAGLGCEFQLVFGSEGGRPMELESARLAADSFCPGWSDSDEGSYELAGGEAQLSFVDRVPDRTAASSCIGSARATFTGTIELRDGSRSVSVDLSPLSIEGDFPSRGNTDATCPCLPVCEGECGTDPVCGTSCGTCGVEEICGADSLCVCAPQCEGRSCGGDGCGGTCSPGCPDEASCDGATGQCSCVASCSGRECGDDGCGGTCGSCTGGDECTSGGICQFPCAERIWEGDASITTSAGVSALTGYTRIDGSLTIEGTSLTSLTGLECLQRVDGILQMRNNPELISFDGLESLQAASELKIWGNDALVRIDALRALNTLGILVLGSNASLRDLDGLSGVGGLLRLSVTDSSLTSLDGLDGLTSIRSMLFLGQNEDLGNIDALASVTEAYRISFRENARLNTLRGLRSVTNLVSLTLVDNDALESLDGLEGLRGETSLAIEGHRNLANIRGLAGLRSLTGLRVAQNGRLTSLNGLHGITAVAGHVAVHQNYILTDFSGLRNLTAIGGNLGIGSNLALTDIEGLHSLRSLGGSLTISDNRMLSTCAAEALRDLLVSRGWTESGRIDRNAACP